MPVLLVSKEVQEYLPNRRAGIRCTLEGLVPWQWSGSNQLTVKPEVQLHLRPSNWRTGSRTSAVPAEFWLLPTMAMNIHHHCTD